MEMVKRVVHILPSLIFLTFSGPTWAFCVPSPPGTDSALQNKAPVVSNYTPLQFAIAPGGPVDVILPAAASFGIDEDCDELKWALVDSKGHSTTFADQSITLTLSESPDGSRQQLTVNAPEQAAGILETALALIDNALVPKTSVQVVEAVILIVPVNSSPNQANSTPDSLNPETSNPPEQLTNAMPAANPDAQGTPIDGQVLFIDRGIPTTPFELLSRTLPDGSVLVAWHPGSDDQGVVGYNLYRNKIFYATVYGQAYIDYNPINTIDTNTIYQISAFDAARNYSYPSHESQSPLAIHLPLDLPLSVIETDNYSLASGENNVWVINASTQRVVVLGAQSALALWPHPIHSTASQISAPNGPVTIAFVVLKSPSEQVITDNIGADQIVVRTIEIIANKRSTLLIRDGVNNGISIDTMSGLIQ